MLGVRVGLPFLCLFDAGAGKSPWQPFLLVRSACVKASAQFLLGQCDPSRHASIPVLYTGATRHASKMVVFSPRLDQSQNKKTDWFDKWELRQVCVGINGLLFQKRP